MDNKSSSLDIYHSGVNKNKIIYILTSKLAHQEGSTKLPPLLSFWTPDYSRLW